MYLYGGCNAKDNNDKLYSLDLSNMKWEIVNGKAANNDQDNMPKPRDEHTAVIAND